MSGVMNTLIDVLRQPAVSGDTCLAAANVIAQQAAELQAVQSENTKLGNLAARCRKERNEAQAALATARREALEEAAATVGQENRQDRGYIPDSLWDKLTREAVARIRALANKETSNAAE